MVYHITKKVEWQKAQKKSQYCGDTLESEGFIHCSKDDQIIRVARHLFTDKQSLVVLAIDETKLQSPLKYEDLEDYGEEFPHIYGPLNIGAVVNVINAPKGLADIEKNFN